MTEPKEDLVTLSGHNYRVLVAERDRYREALSEINLSACYGCEENTDAANEMLRRVLDLSREALAPKHGRKDDD